MINIDEINEEIEKLENCECTSYKVCEKLAILYIVRDHFKGLDQVPAKKNNNINNENNTMMSAMPMMK